MTWNSNHGVGTVLAGNGSATNHTSFGLGANGSVTIRVEAAANYGDGITIGGVYGGGEARCVIHQPVTIGAPPQAQSAAGAGGVRLKASDLSGVTGSSNVPGVHSCISAVVPAGIQIDNAVVTARIESTEDYISQPYGDLQNPSDFSMAWTKLSGTPAWGWIGTSGNLGSLAASETTNLLLDVGFIPADDFVTVTVWLDYDYQGQHQTLQLSYDVLMRGG